jgi:glycosyltransferase involved in cell wall biosynthesis
MFHSILITHRNRHDYLAVALWSIHRSARHCGAKDYEIIIIENGSVVRPVTTEGERLIVDETPMPVFNKSYLYNRGIEETQGEVLSFLDADVLAGREWIRGVEGFLLDPALVRLCYRVRYLSPDAFQNVMRSAERWTGRYFAQYNATGDIRDHRGGHKFRLAFEAWRHHNRNHIEPEYQPFGNGLFSITREKLGDLRFDEGYIGKGGEDIDMAMQIEHRYGAAYRGFLSMEGERSLFCFEHQRDTESWGSAKYQRANNKRYRERKAEFFPGGINVGDRHGL